VDKSFVPDVVSIAAGSQLTITLTNPNPIPLTDVALTDLYPAGLVNAVLPAASTDCGGTLTATPGGVSLSLTDGSIPAEGCCTVTAAVSSALAGTYLNTLPIGSVTTAEAGANEQAADATLQVTLLFRPFVSMRFEPDTVPATLPTLLTITVSNANIEPMTGVAFSNAYPAGLVNARTPMAASTCGGSVTAPPEGDTLALTGGTIPAAQTCSVSVRVASAIPGTYVNVVPAGAVTSSNAGSNVAPASARLVVGLPIPALAAAAASGLVLALAVLRILRTRRSQRRPSLLASAAVCSSPA
jgi:hypothetical protein